MKYELVKEGDYFRIVALKDIDSIGIKKGDLGGLVTNEYTLSKVDDSWIFEDSIVEGEVSVSGNSLIIDSDIKGIGSIFACTIVSSDISICNLFQSKVLHSYLTNVNASNSFLFRSEIYETSSLNSQIYHSKIEYSNVYDSDVKECVVKKDSKIHNSYAYKCDIEQSDIYLSNLCEAVLINNIISNGKIYIFNNTLYTYTCNKIDNSFIVKSNISMSNLDNCHIICSDICRDIADIKIINQNDYKK